MKLYIAEKREVAKALSEALSGTYQDGIFLLPNGDKITHLYGHLLRLEDPEEQNESYKKWQLDQLPMNWSIKTKPQDKHKDYLKNVITLIKEADELVHAGDPDPEGQRLVDEIIEYAKFKKPVWRVLINDNNPKAILQALSKLEDNNKYQGLSQSALARAVGDQRYGYNLTRLYTLSAQKNGYQGVLSVGRVQTPILGLIVRRDELIEQHKEQLYYEVEAIININGQQVKSAYLVAEDDPLDEKKRIIDGDFAKNIADTIKDKKATLREITPKIEKIAPPLPYNLLALQADCASKFSLSPKKVLEITQDLRDKYRAITYNRSDCRFLNDERHDEAEALLNLLSSRFNISGTDHTRKSKAFDSSKVSAHHAIIPTESVPNQGALTQEENQVYELIVNQYIAQFLPHREVKKTVTFFEVENYTFKANAFEELSAGWKALLGQSSDDEEDDSKGNQLNDLSVGQSGNVDDSKCLEKKTKPPKHYTMSELLKDLAQVAKYVKDPKIKALLLDKDNDKADEKGGIGTPATRDAHIETLFSRGYVAEKNKSVISTQLGRDFIHALPEFATAPDLTALWHEKQKQIESGTLTIDDLLAEIDATIAEEIKRVKSHGLELELDLPKCPNCAKNMVKRNGKNGEFWGCSGYPECKTTAPDKKGKPDFEAKFASKSVAPTDSEQHKCPRCEKALIRRPSKKDPKIFWWGCSGYPKCDFTAFDNNGLPKI